MALANFMKASSTFEPVAADVSISRMFSSAQKSLVLVFETILEKGQSSRDTNNHSSTAGT